MSDHSSLSSLSQNSSCSEKIKWIFVALCLLFPLTVRAEQLVNFKAGELVVTLTKLEAELELMVEFKDLTKVDVFSVENPVRIVVDIPNAKILRNKNFPLDGAGLISALRVAAHSDKTRLVLDVLPGVLPEYTQTKTQNSLVLRIVAGAADTTIEPTIVPTVEPSPTPAPSIQPSPTNSPTLTVTSSPAAATPTPPEILTKTPTQTNTVQPSPTQKLTPTVPSPTPTRPPTLTQTSRPSPSPTENADSADAQTLKKIDFDYADEDRWPFVRVTLTKKTDFKLQKKGADTYELVIPEGTITRQYLRLPFYPPQDFVGFNAVLAETRGSDLVVTLLVERGIKITATSNENEIILRSQSK